MKVAFLWVVALATALPMEDFFSPGDGSNTKFPIVEVNTPNQIPRYHSHALKEPDTIFYIKESGSFVARKKKSENEIKTLAKISDEDTEYVELKHTELKKYSYNGMVPASSCLYQDHGGTVGIGYLLDGSFGVGLGVGLDIGIGAAAYGFTIAFGAGISLGTSITLGGSLQCNINEGTWGQVMITPGYVSSTPEFRSVKIESDKVVATSDWKVGATSWKIFKKEVHCVTSNKAPLQCYGFKKDQSLLVEDKE